MLRKMDKRLGKYMRPAGHKSHAIWSSALNQPKIEMLSDFCPRSATRPRQTSLRKGPALSR